MMAEIKSSVVER